jgi:catechol 2,3-dioxygenase-like lactoylglutathione lyase family enzyme
MTLLDAQPFDAARARRRKIRIAVAVVTLLIVATTLWFYRNWPEERVVSHFFGALEKQDYESAYAFYFNDPDWRQHPQKYSQYTYADFYRDWGPGGEWGLIKSFRVYGSADTKGFGRGGVIVEVIVNERAEHARMFVQRSDKTITVYPY